MNGHITNIEKDSIANENFRKVLYTGKHTQLVLMSLKPGEEIGEEVHMVDQFLRIEAGTGKAILDGVEHAVSDGSSILVPGGAKHNVINTSQNEPMKLYTLYSPPEHLATTVHATKADAEVDTVDHFDGKTTE